MGNGIYIPTDKFKLNQNRENKPNRPAWVRATRDLSKFLYEDKLNTHNFTGQPSNNTKNKSEKENCILGVLDNKILLGIQGKIL